MKTILILAKDKEQADVAGAQFPTVEVRKVYPGVKNFPHSFDAVILYQNEEADYELYPEEKQRYANVPIRVLLGSTVHPGAAAEEL